MIACTVLTHNYSAEADVLARSFRAHNPDSEFVVLVVDDAEGGLLTGEAFESLVPSQIGIGREELQRRATMFTPVGLTGAAKPPLIRHLAKRDEPVVYLDADTCVYASLEPLAALAREHGLVLSPQTLDPHPLAAQRSAEQLFAADGPINTGLLAATDAAAPFLDWWAERTARRSVVDRQEGLFNEQGWLTPALTLFRHHLLRDRGCNVMGWNLHNRDVDWDGDTPMIDGEPLRHFHFNYGFRPDHPDVLTPYQRNPETDPARLWPSLADRPGAARICREYAKRLLDAGYMDARARPHRFAVMPEGAELEPWMRERYRAALIRAQLDDSNEPPNPFTHGQDAFLAWVRRAPAAHSGPLEARLDETERQLETTRHELESLRASRSWRSTRPLRAAADALRRATGAGPKRSA